MGDWEEILFERRVLGWATLLVLAGTGLWVVALATPYWLVFTPAKPGRLLWAHSGIWQKCDLVDGEPTPSGLRWHCWDTLRLVLPGNAVSDLLRAEVSLVGVTVLLTMAALGFSCYSISHPRFTFRRLAAVLHLLTAVSTIAVIQLVDTSQELHAAGEGDTLLYGYSYLLAWTSFLISLAAALTFLVASRKRNLLDSDNVLFRHQKLDISVPTK